MDYRELLRKKIDENKEEMFIFLKDLIAIRSVAGDAVKVKAKEAGDKKTEVLPFGEGVHKAFGFMLEKARKEGFETENVENYGGHIEFGGYIYDGSGEMTGTSPEVMGIVCHLDTVPEGEGWKYDPFGCERDGDRIYGRGTIDDKGPAVAVFFAMKALKECGLIPEKKVRLILGLDEETKWEGMEHYLSEFQAPDFGFTPDSEFPLIYGEKGIINFDIASKFSKTDNKGLALRSFKGGQAVNMVAENARVIINSGKPERYGEIKEEAAAFRNEKEAVIKTKVIGKSLEITTGGVSAHGSKPELGVNAISVMMDFLGQFDFTNEDINDFIDFYNRHIGYEINGGSLGCGFSDEPSGKLTVNVGKIEMDTRAVRLSMNVRYPVTQSDKKVYEGIAPVIERYDLGIIKKLHHEPLYRSLDDPMVKTLLAVYREHTGDTESAPKVIGGGTYARAMDNCIAFGASFPGQRDIAHQKDEFINASDMIKMTNIFADAIYRLSKSEIM